MSTGLTALALALTLLASPLPGRGAAGFVVIVHPSNPVEAISREQLSRMFLKRVSRWQHGGRVAPVDQASDSRVRERFTVEVHEKEVGSIQSYWQRMIFSGREIPPAELTSDRAVIEFVATNPEAVGYVTPSAALDGSVKAVRVEV